MSDEVAALRNHIETLEYRLDDYHEHLGHAIRERDELTMDAAWGVAQSIAHLVSSLTSLGVAALAYLFTADLFAKPVSIVVAAIVWVISTWIGSKSLMKVNQSRMDEKDSLAKLPEWESRAEEVWKL